MKYASYSALAGLTLALVWLGWKQHQLAGELAMIRSGRPVLSTSAGKQETYAAAIQELQNRFERTRIDLSAALHGISQTSTKVDSLQKAVDSLNRQMQVTQLMLETNALAKAQPKEAKPSPERPPMLVAEPAPPPAKPKPRRTIVRRPWSAEQATGAPDTKEAGDSPTAWAPLSPNSGTQWLELEYEKPVDIAELRVRQTFNPGAICKITGINASGQEIKIWEGTEPPGRAPVETSFKACCRVQTDKIKIYLDTKRVAGWNEIDAVELIGRDGTRQWAIDAKASTSYVYRKGT